MPLSGFLLEHTLQSGNDLIYFSDHLLYSMPHAAQGRRKKATNNNLASIPQT